MLLRVIPSWDYGSVYNSAVSYASTGSFGDVSYYNLFPHNIGLLLILSFSFKFASLLSFTDFYLVGSILNGLFICLSIFFLYWIIRNKISIKMAFFTLIICIFVTPFFTYVPIFYTDTMSMPFITCSLYMLECVNLSKKSLAYKICFYITVGLVLFIGCSIKITVMISFIAIFIFHILSKKKLKGLCFVAGIFIVINVIYSNTVVAVINDKSDIDAIPYTHWIMMGMNKETLGGYNEKDYSEITRSIDSKAGREKVNIVEIKNRLRDFGIVGYTNFLIKKTSFTWGDGTYFAPEKLRRQVINHSTIHEFVLVDGKYFYIYYIFCQTVHFTMILFIPISSFIIFKRKKYSFMFIPLLALLGLFVFLLFWETRSRYLINFIPLIIMQSLVSFELLFAKILHQIHDFGFLKK